MGPRSGERGNRVRSIPERSMASTLQWGRAPKSAEIQTPGQAVRARMVMLQWGRAPKSAETTEREGTA